MADAFHLKLLLATFSGWVNRGQAQVIDYQAEVIQVLKEQLGGKRPRLTDDQRRRLAAKGKPLGRRLLDKVAAIVTPDTILRWHRKLIVRMANETSGWGYLRIQGELRKVGHIVARTTIAKTLKDNGIAPSPDRPTSGA